MCLGLLGGGALLALPSEASTGPEAPRPSSTSTSRPTPTPPPRPAPTPVWPATGAPVPAVPRIVWGRCDEAAQRKLGLQCAAVRVPLSYAHPQKASILLNVARHPAKSGRRKGVLFFNPGGPGTSAIERADTFLEMFGKSVTDVYDVIAMDPRGIGVDSLAGCWSVEPAPNKPDEYPVSSKEVKQQIARDAFERHACAATGRPIIDHMTTANVARDMDLIRRGMSVPKISFYGVSYGTYLGATYSALFPQQTGPFVLDGVVDPVSSSTGRGGAGATTPVSVRTNSGSGADESLKALFRACEKAGATRCRHGAYIAKEWEAVLARLDRGAVTIDGETHTRPRVISSAMQALYSIDTLSPLLDWIHQEYLVVVKGARTAAPAPVEGSRSMLDAPPAGPVIEPSKPQPDNAQWFDTFKQAGVLCSDSVNPADPLVWQSTAQAAKSSWFTPLWTWHSSICAGWPGSKAEAYFGSFAGRPASPLLIIGNTHDPATPLQQAKLLAQTSPGARLLTVDTFGHGAGNQSTCAVRAARSYLLKNELPKRGAVCAADKPLF